MSDILMIVTGATSLTLTDGTEHPTGFWAEELVVAHRELRAAGHTHHHRDAGRRHSDGRRRQPLGCRCRRGREGGRAARLPRRDRARAGGIRRPSTRSTCRRTTPSCCPAATVR